MALRHITPHSGPWPLHGVLGSRRAEAAALTVSPHPALMQAAGLSLAKLTLALHPHARRIRVMAGPGNNGGDGFVAARHLAAAGRTVEVVFFGASDRLPVDAAEAFDQARLAGVPISSALGFWGDADIHVDALLGLGVTRAAEGAMAEAIALMNRTAVPVISADLPSGLLGDTGAALGEAVVKASATLSMLTLKPGLFTAAGRDFAGDVWFDELGGSSEPPDAELAAPRSVLPERPHASHKGRFGDVAVVGGAAGMTGAAILAARAALACGAGRVFCSLLAAGEGGDDPGRPEVMFRPNWWLSAPDVLARSTVACGCGGGDRVAEALPALLAHAARLVLDADALNAVASNRQLSTLLAARRLRGLGTVITPHPLEAARLLDTTPAKVQADRIASATELAASLKCIVVLKGSGTCIAAPDRLPTVNPTGNALLSTAGTGDVLAGWLAGLWAQGVGGWEAACASVWLHGDAADSALAAGRRRPLLADDLLRRMACAP